ncbi:MAG: hypothetical protein IT462_15180 [Planctomycetes bacterium]|nr:hypothetical protein [Planctomycetota bacterium]
MKTFLTLILLSVGFLAACDPKPAPDTRLSRPVPVVSPRKPFPNKLLESASGNMREAVTEELGASSKTLADRNNRVAAYIDAAADPLLLVQSLASKLGVVIGKDAFEAEMLRRFEIDVLSGGDIESELKACADRVCSRWAKTLDGLAAELKSSGLESPQEVLASLKTPSVKFNAVAAQPAIQRQLQRAAVLGGSFALAPGLAKASLKLLSLFFDAGKWFAKWSSVVSAGAEIAITLALDNLGESALGLREGAAAQTRQLVVETVDGVIDETSVAWMASADDVLNQFAKAAKGGGR